MDKLKILWAKASSNIPAVLKGYPEVAGLIFVAGFLFGALLL